MTTIKKAIIPAAGLGTRFLPATKAMPKEMLPIVDKPTIQYIVEEAVQSGIEDIIIVTGKHKRAIEDHFDNNVELEQNLMQKEKYDLLEKVNQTSNVDIHYIRQKEQLGLGHAIWCARKFIGDDPFAVLLGDDIVEADTPCLKQLIQQFEETERSVLGVQQVPHEETNRYGIVDSSTIEGKRYKVDHFVEKPSQEEAPSNLAIMGRYVLTPEIFKHLDKHKIGAGGEIQLTDAIQMLSQEQDVYAFDFAGTRFDVGEKYGFIQTTLEFAMKDPEIGDDVADLIQKLAKQNNIRIQQ